MERWKKIFNNKYTLKYIQYYNLIILVVYTIGCYLYLFEQEDYKWLYDIFVAIFGFNLSSHIFVGYLLSRLKFCKWQVIAFFFNIAISVIGILFTIIPPIKNDIAVMTVLATIFSTYTVTYMIFEIKKRNLKNKTMSIP